MTEKKMDLTAGGKTMDIKELDAEIAKMTAGVKRPNGRCR